MRQQHAQSQAGPRHDADTAPRRALLLDSDLFFAVKVADTLKHAGYITRTVRRAEDFAAALTDERPAVALINAGARGLEWRSAISAARSAGIPVVVYAPHVDVETHEAARTAGATSVIANSKLAADLPGVVARALRRGNTAADAVDVSRDGPDADHGDGSDDGE